MSFYLTGCESEGLIGAEYEGDYFTPGAVQDEMRVLDGAISSLALDVSVSTIDPQFKEAFASFQAEWSSFLGSNQGWFSRALNKTYAMVIEYRERLTKWRAKFKSLGGVTTSPALPKINKTAFRRPAIFFVIGIGLGYYLTRRD
jgi:hypothetical protein